MRKDFFHRLHLKTGGFKNRLNLLFASHLTTVKLTICLHLFIKTSGNLIGCRLHFINTGIDAVDRSVLLFHGRHDRPDRTQATACLFNQTTRSQSLLGRLL